MGNRNAIALAQALLVSACGASSPQLPYPAFVAVDELPDTFVAELPGVRAKGLVGNPDAPHYGLRVDAPRDWSFSSGASPSKSVEIFVLAGTLAIGEFPLGPGGYGWLPPGYAGISLRTDTGARFLYFIDDARPQAVIQTPIIATAGLLEWRHEPDGTASKVLRDDPGSGVRTKLLRISPGNAFPWRRAASTQEGYLTAGTMTGAECVNGDVVAEIYEPGGYFIRPPGAVHGGPREITADGAVWYLRTDSGSEDEPAVCAPGS